MKNPIQQINQQSFAGFRHAALLHFLGPCFGFYLSAALSPMASAQACRDGCNSTNTFQGVDALPVATGADNTAFGYIALQKTTTGYGNTAIGALALVYNTVGTGNTAVGLGALTYYYGSDSTAIGVSALAFAGSGPNTAVGSHALYNNYDGFGNTAMGVNALYYNNEGFFNTATGEGALYSNSDGDWNTAMGYQALYSNSGGYVQAGYSNTAVGALALFGNARGNSNTAIGAFALLNNTDGGSNTAIGKSALLYNTEGFSNTAMGDSALQYNTKGTANTALGTNALDELTIGSDNTAVGTNAGSGTHLLPPTGNGNTAVGSTSLYKFTSGSDNTALGYNALSGNTTGSSNIALGVSAGSLLTTGSNNIDIGHEGSATDSNTIRIGKKTVHTKTVIAGIRGTTVSGGLGVLVDSNGRLGTTTSSARFKEQIEPMDKTSEALHALKPVTFRYKKELDPAAIPQFGLVAEEVAKINPDLVVKDDQGKPYTVRYDAVNAMLLNEFLKEHRRVEAQETTITELQSALAEQRKELTALMAGLKDQGAQIQKVSAELAVTKAAPRVVATNP